ncbi:MAG: hypothetical protein V3V63_03660 [Candidatus Hydrothermarchaeaceae archaeon]
MTVKYARISGKIPAEDKEKIKLLVKKGLFKSMSEFHEIAGRRLLRDLETYVEKKKKVKKKIFEKTEDKVIKEMKDIGKFVDDLF